MQYLSSARTVRSIAKSVTSKIRMSSALRNLLDIRHPVMRRACGSLGPSGSGFQELGAKDPDFAWVTTLNLDTLSQYKELTAKVNKNVILSNFNKYVQAKPLRP